MKRFVSLVICIIMLFCISCAEAADKPSETISPAAEETPQTEEVIEPEKWRRTAN